MSNTFKSDRIERLNLTKRDLDAMQSIDQSARLIEDVPKNFKGLIVRKPWGYEYLLYENNHVAIWILNLKRGASTSMHAHPKKRTSLIVLEGVVTCSTLNSDILRKAGDAVEFEAGVFHQTSVLSQGGATVMEIETPVDKSDLVRLKDNYGRVGQGYEGLESYCQVGGELEFAHEKVASLDFLAKKQVGSALLWLSQKKFELKPDTLITVIQGEIRSGTDTLVRSGETIEVTQLGDLHALSCSADAQWLISENLGYSTRVLDYVISFLSDRGLREIDFSPPGSQVKIETQFKSMGFKVSTSRDLTYLNQKIELRVLGPHPSVEEMLGSVARAFKLASPLVVFSIHGISRGAPSTDGIQMIKPFTKYAVRVTEPKSIRYHLEKALYLATHGRAGPVWIELPEMVLDTVVEKPDLWGFDLDYSGLWSGGFMRSFGGGDEKKFLERPW